MDQHLLRALMESSSDAIYFKDLDSRFLMVSQAQAHLFGLERPEDVVGKSDFDFFTAEHASQAYQDEQRIIETREPMIGIEEKETWPDGHQTWVLTSKMPLYDEAGNLIGTFGISRDITERKLAEEALRESREQLRQKNEIMEFDLARAQVIQRAILPPNVPHYKRLSGAVRYEPMESVGGDYYGFCAEANTLGFFIGDLTGHGVSAALFMALIKFLSDRLMDEYRSDAAGSLRQLNQELMHQMSSTFITAIQGHFDLSEAGPVRLRLAGGGHPEPLLYRAATGHVEKVVLNNNAALGLIPEFETENMELELASGDCIFFYTDGLTESSDNANRMLGIGRLGEIIRNSISEDLRDTLDRIMEGVDHYRERQTVADDALLLGFKVLD